MRKRRTGKYHAVKTVIDGITFDSKGEAKRYQELQLMLKAGEISEFSRQVPFVLAPAVVLNGRKKPALRYVADFVYCDRQGLQVVEDFKGVVTPVYVIKRHLMKHIHNIEILEVTA